MYQIKTFNRISPMGLNRFDTEHYCVGEDVENPHGIVVRSAKLLDYEFPSDLLGISRAGVGFNNIPVDRCSEAGIAVFSTPGANANAVKELGIAALMMASRDLTGGYEWVRNVARAGDQDVAKAVEKGKSAFVGSLFLLEDFTQGVFEGIAKFAYLNAVAADSDPKTNAQKKDHDRPTPDKSVDSTIDVCYGFQEFVQFKHSLQNEFCQRE